MVEAPERLAMEADAKKIGVEAFFVVQHQTFCGGKPQKITLQSRCSRQSWELMGSCKMP